MKNCLEGSRASVYKVIMKKHKNDDLAKTDPGAVFQEIKARLLLFAESATEHSFVC